MHTDDDIFESLDIGESLGKTADTGEKKAGAVFDYLNNEDDADDIFESLDMEDKIYDTAFTPNAKANDAARQTTGNSKASSRSRSDFDEFDLSGQKQKSHKAPKELNTADTSVDRRKYTSDKENKKKSRIKRIIIGTVVELLTLVAIFAYGYVLKSWNMIARPQVRLEAVENNNISVEKKKEMEGYWNIAVFGVDSRGDSVVERGINSDVIMIVSINKDTGDIKIVSVFRDTYLNISDKNSYNKINQAYAIGGPEQALAALNKNLDLNIQHYVAFNWKAPVSTAVPPVQ